MGSAAPTRLSLPVELSAECAVKTIFPSLGRNLMQSNITIQDSLKTFSHDQDKTRPRAHNCLGARDPRQIQNERACQDDAIGHGRLDIPIYISLCGEDATRFTGTKKQMGKGATPQQSEASALMELMERFSFFYFIHQYPFPTYKYGELDDFAVSVRDLKKSIYDTETPDELCEAFLKDFPMRWVKALNRPAERTSGRLRWFNQLTSTRTRRGQHARRRHAPEPLRGVERHVWSDHQQRLPWLPRNRPESLRDPATIDLVKKFRDKGIRLFLRDFSLDTGIPTWARSHTIRQRFPKKSEIVFTADHSNPESRCGRALRNSAVAGDFESRTSYRPTLPKVPSLEEALHDDDGQKRRSRAFPTSTTTTCGGNRACVGRSPNRMEIRS